MPGVCIDEFFDRRQTPTYNCLDFTAEIWLKLKGEELRDKLPKLQGAFKDRHVGVEGARTFVKLNKPVSPCIALMQRSGEMPHVGVYIEGKIAHLTPKGVQCLEPYVVTYSYDRVRYYV